MTRDEHAAETHMSDQQAQDLKTWQKPRFNRFCAGSAEDGAAVIPDAGAFPS